MKSRLSIALFSVFSLFIVTAPSHAFDFKSVANGPAILYDAPSYKAGKIFIAPRGMPVEVILTYGEWNKVRDFNGDMFWIESKVLGTKRNVIVTVPNAKIRSNPNDSANVVFSANKNVLLELIESTTQATSGWLKVQHIDGQNGYIKRTEVWGE